MTETPPQEHITHANYKHKVGQKIKKAGKQIRTSKQKVKEVKQISEAILESKATNQIRKAL